MNFGYDLYTALTAAIVITHGLLDTVTTYVAIWCLGTHEHELNPIVHTLLDIHPSLLLVLKVISIGIAVFVFAFARDAITHLPYWYVVVALIALFGLVAAGMNTATIWYAC